MIERSFDGGVACSVVPVGGIRHVIAVSMSRREGPAHKQASAAVRAVREAAARHDSQAEVVAQTVFLKDAADQDACQRAFAAEFGSRPPVTAYVLQPPCNRAALTLEVWAVSGDLRRQASKSIVSVRQDDVTWVYCGGVTPKTSAPRVYDRSLSAFARMRKAVDGLDPGFDHVMRTWLYLGDIVGPEGDTQRYKELNRARSDFYRGIPFCNAHLAPRLTKRRASGLGVYPASTGIGMKGSDVTMSCLALDTTRKDVFLMPLENPQQTPAYAYSASYSPQSPKFSRAMAVAVGPDVLTFVSGTASIVDSETRHVGDVEKQTEQTIENIGRLISAQNFASHGLKGAGAALTDMAVIRVYVKRPRDYPKCKAICERRFGRVPTIYAVADVCRPELLVEIEGIAFSSLAQNP